MLSLANLKSVLPVAGVLLVALAVNLPTLHDYFHGDDYLAFVDMVSKPFGKHMTEVITFKDSDVYWRPLGELYYVGIWNVFGLNEVAFHAANITVFLVTLVLLYAFCLQAGLGRYVAAGSCLVLTLFPNHVVSVSWITNGSRLVAVMFALASLVLLQRAIATRKAYFEVLAVVAFLMAPLADETTLALAPLLVAYSFLFDREEGRLPRRTLARMVPYALIVGVIAPLQVLFTRDDPSFSVVGFGWQMPQHFWALTSKLVLPTSDSITFSEMGAEQWAAGAIALVALALALLWGSSRLRFLVLWIVLAILPFTLWLTPLAPARYVYMAAVPFAVAVSWMVVALAQRLRATRPGAFLSRGTMAPVVLAGVAMIALVFLGSVGAAVTRERDRRYARDTEPYRLLAKYLPQAAPTVPKGGRIVIYYGIWTSYFIWPDAVAKTIYRDPTLHVVNVSRGQIDSGWPGGRKANDVVLFYTGKGFIRAAPMKTATVAN